eukprot:GHVS01011500.1.p1 GENE.GHVS01011500.1~~GHVS01011500.1.p1  ORF type:complete len:121 (-),score=17.81 GHVS01011500.1:103-465(-)
MTSKHTTTHICTLYTPETSAAQTLLPLSGSHSCVSWDSSSVPNRWNSLSMELGQASVSWVTVYFSKWHKASSSNLDFLECIVWHNRQTLPPPFLSPGGGALLLFLPPKVLVALLLWSLDH